MPRPPAPCGTYPAYRRHLRNREAVDEACRRAQREHDSSRDRGVTSSEPVGNPIGAAHAAVIAKARAVLASAESGDAYGVLDRYYELDPLLEVWCEAIDRSRM